MQHDHVTGLTNTVTAVKNAQMAESPILLLGGAAPRLLKVLHLICFIVPEYSISLDFLFILSTVSGIVVWCSS